MVKKIGVFITILGLVFVGMPQFNIKAQEIEYTNLASPDLEGKEYLGNGVYRFYSDATNYVDYNVFTGVYTNHTNYNDLYYTFELDNTKTYVLSVYKLKKDTFRSFYIVDNNDNNLWHYHIHDDETIVLENVSSISLRTSSSSTFDYEGQIKIMINEGDTATPYQVPIQA